MERMEAVTLSNGVEMPVLGYGVFQIVGPECERCVGQALDAGYRLIDTAQSYGNEREVGRAIASSGVAREEIFLTTKVWPEFYGRGSTRCSIEESLKKLQTDYLDLVLLHQPYGDTFSAWSDLIDLYRMGVVRAIGVSNFYADRLVELCEFSDLAPMVNQMECHPLCQQRGLMEWASKYNVRLEAWAPFGEGRGDLFTNPCLLEIAGECGKTTAQVMLRWALQRGIVVIPKTVRVERMRENLDVFDFSLSENQMGRIEALDTATSAFFAHDDPVTVQMFAKMIQDRKE